MPTGVAAKRYAQAAFELALERDELDQWSEELSRAVEIASTPEVLAFLEHAKVPLSRKVDVVHEVFPDISPLVRNLLGLLVGRGLIDRLLQVQQEYQRLVNRHKGRIPVQVASAVALDDRQLERVQRSLGEMTGKEVVLDTRVDPTLLGGLVIRIEDVLMDGSIKARLDSLRRSVVRVVA